MGAVRVVRAFVPGMMERKTGHIVLFGSEDAEQPYVDEPPCCAAKAVTLNLSKGLSKTYAEHGILVNAVSPTLGLQRRGRADEVAAAVVFLCSRQASFITGLDMRIDGGSVATV